MLLSLFCLSGWSDNFSVSRSIIGQSQQVLLVGLLVVVILSLYVISQQVH